MLFSVSGNKRNRIYLKKNHHNLREFFDFSLGKQIKLPWESVVCRMNKEFDLYWNNLPLGKITTNENFYFYINLVPFFSGHNASQFIYITCLFFKGESASMLVEKRRQEEHEEQQVQDEDTVVEENLLNNKQFYQQMMV